MVTAVQLLLSAREYDAFKDFIRNSITDDTRHPVSPVIAIKKPPLTNDHNAAAFRSASRVYLGTAGILKGYERIAEKYLSKKQPRTATPRKPLVASSNKMALSLGLLLFFHRVLYRLFSRLRLQLLHEKVREIRHRYPKIYAALTSRLAPAIGASLSGLALGICPQDQLRVTIAIYAIVRALELTFTAFETAGYMKGRKWWVGSWMFYALSQGQLLHAFLFDRDCFPESYGAFILDNTPEYIQRRPAALSSKVVWPTRSQIVDGLANMARLKWPVYVSPILHPKQANTLPLTIDPVISPITSRAHPAIQHLSCALIHPSDPSCFVPFLQQLLLSFTTVGRFLAIYYGAMSLLRVKQLYKRPLSFLNNWAKRVLTSTAVLVGSIGCSWGSICFFNQYLPRGFLPRFRFFLGGAISGSIAIIDRSKTGHDVSMYATRTSLDSLWKVGVKHRWWKGIKGGDVYLFVTALGIMNVLYDLQRNGKAGRDQSMVAVRLLRGEVEVGLANEDKKAA